METNKIYNGNCLELMPKIPTGSVDMILCDLPYGTTNCAWDEVIPFEPLWNEYNRVIKDNGAIVLTASQPFTTKLINSNFKDFRYSWIWEKSISSNFFNANKQPLKKHEDVLVFYKKPPTYNPQKEKRDYVYIDSRSGESKGCKQYSDTACTPQDNGGYFYPSSIIKIANPNNNNFHPTQKPVELFEYLIKTYTNTGEIVLDNTAGSGTTAIACINTDRKFICMELDEIYFLSAEERINLYIMKKHEENRQITLF